MKILPVVFPQDNVFDWAQALIQFVATVLAAALSFYVARWTVEKSAKTEIERLKLERHDEAKASAITVAFKILDYGELLAGTERHLAEQFKQAELANFRGEPFQLIRGAEGEDFLPEIIGASELAFLIDQQKYELIGEIRLIYRRLVNINHLMRLYSKERSQFGEWLQKLPGYQGKLDEDVSREIFPIKYADVYERRAASLNVFISSVVEQLEDTLVLLSDVFPLYIEACQREFEDFPKISADFPQDKTDLNTLRAICSSKGIKFHYFNTH